MDAFTFYPSLLLIFLATLTALVTVLYGLYYMRRYGPTQQVTTFTIFAGSIFLWSFFAMGQLTAQGYERTLLAYKLLHFGSFTASPAIFFYALSMGTARRWVTWKTVALPVVFLIPVFGWLFTDPVPILLVDPHLDPIGAFSVIEHGNSPIYVAYLSAFYVIATVGLSYIVAQAWTDRSIGRLQTAILVPAIFAPMLLSVFQTFQLLPFEPPGTILTPTSFSVGMAGIGYAAFRYDAFDTKSLARSRTIERMNEGYVLANTTDRIIDANRSASDLLDVDPPLVGESISTVLPGDDEWQVARTTTPSMFEVEIEQSDRTLEVSASKFTTNGQTVGTLFVFRDITVRKATQETLEEQRDTLQLLNQVVRHDIRNDLQVVLASAELLESAGPLTEDQQDRVVAIRENARHAVDLTTTARELANVMIEAGTETRSVDIAPVLEDAIAEVRNTFEAVTVDVDGSIPDWQVRANEMVDSVFRNVLKNAVQHNDSEQPRVTISVAERPGRVRIRVADNGPGIPEARRDAIFGKGERGLDSNGTGIGLYLVYTLVESYGGTVWVEDNDPRGAVFVIELPRASD